MSTKTHVGALKPFSACCCMISSCFLEFPNCIGCEGEGEMLCMEGSWKCLKTMDANADGNEDKRCCACCQTGIYCIKPKTVSINIDRNLLDNRQVDYYLQSLLIL